MSDKAILTCALTGVLTDPAMHNVPVTPEQMAEAAAIARDSGMAVHLDGARLWNAVAASGVNAAASPSSSPLKRAAPWAASTSSPPFARDRTRIGV